MLEWLDEMPGEAFGATYLFKLAWGQCSNVRLQPCTRPPRVLQYWFGGSSPTSPI